MVSAIAQGEDGSRIGVLASGETNIGVLYGGSLEHRS